MFQSNDLGAQPPTVPPAQSSQPKPRREKVTNVLYGSLEALDRMTKQLHTLHYADPNDWSDPIPSGRDSQWMVVLIKHLLIE
ncbi:hypothetical protein [Pseudanabaena sp. FACHB-2040]|uniref:hypothetical protein n=1 Tax=Pseudanabaena sp. FACHB-2040 TaxID=2692859 RepID=UPI0016870D23|nr:hypothetical protein [Pseudanabaena sp. FACHB-2040]MBD2260106.1 hypothetical protein [Pseudanabaena sp. FACHB-2040]